MRPDSPNGRASHRLRGYALAVVLVAAATWLELLVAVARSPVTSLSLTPFGLSVALTVWAAGLGPGLAALVLSALSLDYYVVRDPLVMIGYVACWLAFCAVAEREHRGREQDRERCRNAERDAIQASRVAQLTAALSHARSRRAAVEAAVQEPLHALGADAGMLILVERDGACAEVARAVGYAEGDERLAIASDRKTPVTDAVGRGAPVYIEHAAAYAAEYRVDAAARRLGVGALVAVPLLVGSAVVAVVQLEFRQPRRFDDDDREYVDVLGRRAAQALDRTGEFESALQGRVDADTLRARADEELARRQATEAQLRASEGRYRTLAARTARLHGLAAALSESATQAAVARAVVQHGSNVLGARSGEVLLLGEEAFQVLYSDVPCEGRDATRSPLEEGWCATEAVRAREPVFVSSFEDWQERFPRSASMAADGGFSSSATLPLLVDGAPIGVLAFHFTAPVNFDDEYRALLRSVGQHCAQALDRARQYEAAQRARTEAEQANRLKDKFVSIVSHELRTPLNAILGWTSMLHQRWSDAAMLERGLQSIHDNATRQARLVEDLLDFSRLQSGRLALEMEDVELRAVLRGVVETIVPTATAQRLHLDVEPIPPLKIRADPRRLEQVFLNLLGNAVKFTPEGGHIGIAVHERPGMVEVRVTDTGEGIEPEFLPHMFDAFRQAETSRRTQGVGLGLAIARELVEAHKGQIAAESDGTGRGSTFVVTLPTAEPAITSATVH